MFLLTASLAIMLLPLTLLLVGVSLGLKSSADREKCSPFECGFSNKFSARLPFSLRFFVIALIFLVFDVELILLFPAVPATWSAYVFSWQSGVTLVLTILLAGLAHEVFQGSLSWAS